MLSFTQAHVCGTPFCNISRDSCAIPHKNKHDRVLRYHRYKYRWASKPLALLAMLREGAAQAGVGEGPKVRGCGGGRARPTSGGYSISHGGCCLIACSQCAFQDPGATASEASSELSAHMDLLSAPKSQRFLRFAIAMPIADPRNRAISETRANNVALRFKGAMERR